MTATALNGDQDRIPTTAAGIPYEGTDCTPEEAVEAVKRARQMMTALTDHPYTDPGDGRTECDVCGKFVWPVTHSCKGVPVTPAAMTRMEARNGR